MASRRRRNKRNDGTSILLKAMVYMLAIPLGLIAILLKALGALFHTHKNSTPMKTTSASAPSTKTTARAPIKTGGPGKWLPPGATVQVHGISLTGGLIYVGSVLKAATGQDDPCLINPDLPIASRSQPVPLDGYWPKYDALNPQARRTYLEWLASGRKNPTDIGYVFLYFYGLERRAIYDTALDISVRADYPLIAAELTRLLALYGSQSNSFKRYAEKLLDWVTFSNETKTYTSAALTKVTGSTMQIKFALGQASVDATPIPAKLALEWIRKEPGLFPLRTPATRCPTQFQSVFETRYRERFGSGMVIHPNKRPLQFSYQPASSSLNTADISLRYADIPDVGSSTKTVTGLQDIIESATLCIEPYSRYLAKNSQGHNDLEALVMLPPYLWPTQMRQSVHAIKRTVLKAPLTITYAQLMQDLGSTNALSTEKAKALAQSLEVLNIGMEPDILSSMKPPRLNDTMVLFDLPVSPDPSREDASYKAGFLTVQLAAAVACADGVCSPEEQRFVEKNIERWSHLCLNHRRRLAALWRIQSVNPIKLQAIVKQMMPLSTITKLVILDFADLLLQKDGVISRVEVVFIGKIYTALGLDATAYHAKHQALLAQPPSKRPSVPAPKTIAVGGKKPFQLDPVKIAALQDETAQLTGLLIRVNETEPPVEEPLVLEVPQPPVKAPLVQLDMERIAALQQDTQLVDNLLANIFTDNEPAPEKSLDPVAQSDENERLPVHETMPAATLLPGLDAAHDALARYVLVNSPCSREDLQKIADGLDLMLDGALERLNDACFDLHDAPFFEGDDPIEINLEIKDTL